MAKLEAILVAVRGAAESIGVTKLKDEQKDALVAFASGRDVFVSLPTGYGKSLCYSCLPGVFARLRNSDCSCASSSEFPIVVIVSPLVSIMKDQTRDFNQRGLSSIYITSSLDQDDELTVLQGKFNLVYISPEQLLARGKWRDMLRSDMYQERMVGFAIDEAHCVKQWYVPNFFKQTLTLGLSLHNIRRLASCTDTTSVVS